MDTHQSDARVQEDGCEALRCLDLNRERATNKKDLTTVAFEAIAEAIWEHDENSQLTAKGCQALSNIFRSGSEVPRSWRCESAISRHTNVAQVQEAGCELLWLFGKKTDKGQEVVLRAAEAHRTNVRVQEMARAYLTLDFEK